METVDDPELVRVLIANLLENAWKFTGPRKHARIAMMRAGAGVFAVRDNGVGFNVDFADLLFKPFARLHREDEFPGNGVGLTTVERIVRRHGGAVWGAGRPGEGASFYFKQRRARHAQLVSWALCLGKLSRGGKQRGFPFVIARRQCDGDGPSAAASVPKGQCRGLLSKHRGFCK